VSNKYDERYRGTSEEYNERDRGISEEGRRVRMIESI
jgi:hypothetical protein